MFEWQCREKKGEPTLKESFESLCAGSKKLKEGIIYSTTGTRLKIRTEVPNKTF
jgi:molybdenum cofactor biosynthesis enzyme MoaA